MKNSKQPNTTYLPPLIRHVLAFGVRLESQREPCPVAGFSSPGAERLNSRGCRAGKRRFSQAKPLWQLSRIDCSPALPPPTLVASPIIDVDVQRSHQAKQAPPISVDLPSVLLWTMGVLQGKAKDQSSPPTLAEQNALDRRDRSSWPCPNSALSDLASKHHRPGLAPPRATLGDWLGSCHRNRKHVHKPRGVRPGQAS